MKTKKVAIIFFTVLCVAIGTIVVLNNFAERKIGQFLEEELKTEQLEYQNIDAHILSGNVEIDAVFFAHQHLKVTAENLKISGFSYVDFLWNGQVTIDEIYLDSPRLEFRQPPNNTAKNEKNRLPRKEKPPLKKNISIESVQTENGSALVFQNPQDTLLYVENFSAKIDSVQVTSNSLRQTIPFGHAAHHFKTSGVYFNLNEYHEITVDEIEISDEKIALQNLSLRPKYSRSEFRALIPYEKDMFRLEIAVWKIERPFFDFFAEKPVFKSPLMIVEEANFKAYRDKIVADDPRTKKMYSALLRDLPFRVDIAKTELRNAFVQYQERIKKDRPPGLVAFYDLNAEITDLTNLNWGSENFPTTKLNIDARFMNTSDLHVNWQMDVGSERDYFTISGSAKNIPPKAMNPFFVPAMNIKAKGGIDAVYFNFGGDYINANGDMKMDYSNFSVEVLKKNGEEKNGFLSAIANIFVKKNPKNGTVSKQNVSVERDPTKSFWNYFWSCIEKGLLKSVL